MAGRASSWRIWLLLLVLAGLGPRWWGIHHVDVHADEPIRVLVGDLYVRSAAQGDFSEAVWSHNMWHPPVAKWLYGLAFQLSYLKLPPLTWYRAPKLLAGLLTLAAAVVMALLGRRLYGPATGLLAGGLLAFMPQVVGHSRIAGLEAPGLLFWALAFYATVRALDQGAGSNRWWWVVGLALALAAGTRMSNGLILPTVAASLLAVYLWPEEGLAWPGWSWPLLLWPLAGGLIFYLIWPWLWVHPWANLVQSLTEWKQTTYQEYFLGRFQVPPWYYYFVYLAVTTPPLLLAGLLAWLGLGFRDGRGRSALVLAWIAGPLLMTFVGLKQDGLRYVFPVLGPLALAAARGLVLAGEGLAARLGRPRWSTGSGLAAGGLALAGCLWAMVSFWPHHIDYYNIFAGSPESIFAAKRFRIGWWGEGVQAAADVLNRVAPSQARVGSDAPELKEYLNLRPDLRRVELAEADFALTNRHLDEPEKWRGWRLVHQESFKGAPLARLYERGS